MEIIRTSRELSKKELIRYTIGANAQKMSELVGQKKEVEDFIFYSDTTHDGVEQQLLTIKFADGDIRGTNSPTFIEMFRNIIDVLDGEAVGELEIVGGVSKSGRDFITCAV